MKWQPIETAPKDTIFLAYISFVTNESNGFIITAQIVDGVIRSSEELAAYKLLLENYEGLDKRQLDYFLRTEYSSDATHWMPLPEPPEEDVCSA